MVNGDKFGPAVKVKSLISGAFGVASRRQKATRGVWIRISHRIGSRLPKSELVVAIQHLGNLDVLLRCMEEEIKNDMHQQEDPESSYHFLCMLSEVWICNTYEIFRLLRSRKLAVQNDGFKFLHRDLKLLRITIAKHEIANDWKLPSQVQMTTATGEDETSGNYVYSKSDRRRAHIMRMGLSLRGSLTWEATDGTSSRTWWLERLSLSERILALWGPD